MVTMTSVPSGSETLGDRARWWWLHRRRWTLSSSAGAVAGHETGVKEDLEVFHDMETDVQRKFRRGFRPMV
ncbi:hypothetical protein SETIT_5G362900v2 [Setaria italica]|uniref:Uncharacterized protein n=1 Tax=Setaria italica TaxID=4555 RepID=A0A368RCV6_SETIT|nr:hypothetical protein SETIT_5G362900v2 [Setaria italica]